MCACSVRLQRAVCRVLAADAGIIYLTPHGRDIEGTSPSGDLAGGAGAPEIVMTPQMIECGFRELVWSGITDEPMEADKLLVARIYRAMHSSRPRGN